MRKKQDVGIDRKQFTKLVKYTYIWIQTKSTHRPLTLMDWWILKLRFKLLKTRMPFKNKIKIKYDETFYDLFAWSLKYLFLYFANNEIKLLNLLLDDIICHRYQKVKKFTIFKTDHQTSTDQAWYITERFIYPPNRRFDGFRSALKSITIHI